LSSFKPFKMVKPFNPPPLPLPRFAGEDTGGELNPSAVLRTGSAKRLNSLNVWNSN
jgi:hypothetical protein